MGAKKPKPEKIPGPKLTPKKSHAAFPSLKNIQKALNSFLKTKSGCTLFAARPGYVGTTTNLQIDLNTEKIHN